LERPLRNFELQGTADDISDDSPTTKRLPEEETPLLDLKSVISESGSVVDGFAEVDVVTHALWWALPARRLVIHRG